MAASDRLTLCCDGAVRLDHERLSAVLTVARRRDRRPIVAAKGGDDILAALCAGLLAFSRR